jgi:hypothetical protein
MDTNQHEYLLSQNNAVAYLGSAAASAAVRRASRRTGRCADIRNGESIPRVCVSREPRLTPPEAGALPLTASLRPGACHELFRCGDCGFNAEAQRSAEFRREDFPSTLRFLCVPLRLCVKIEVSVIPRRWKFMTGSKELCSKPGAPSSCSARAARHSQKFHGSFPIRVHSCPSVVKNS